MKEKQEKKNHRQTFILHAMLLRLQFYEFGEYFVSNPHQRMCHAYLWAILRLFFLTRLAYLLPKTLRTVPEFIYRKYLTYIYFFNKISISSKCFTLPWRRMKEKHQNYPFHSLRTFLFNISKYDKPSIVYHSLKNRLNFDTQLLSTEG